VSVVEGASSKQGMGGCFAKDGVTNVTSRLWSDISATRGGMHLAFASFLECRNSSTSRDPCFVFKVAYGTVAAKHVIVPVTVVDFRAG